MKKEYCPKLFGVIVGLSCWGLAHFASGQKRAGILWYVSLMAVIISLSVTLCMPGKVFLVIALLLGIGFLCLWLWMLVQSYSTKITIKARYLVLTICTVLFFNWCISRICFMVFETVRMSSNSMYPTIKGPSVVNLDRSSKPLSQIKCFIDGYHYVDYYAETSGRFAGPFSDPPYGSDVRGYIVGEDSLVLPKSAKLFFSSGDFVKKGDLIWSGYRVTPDYVWVEKFSYLLRKPRRGEIVMFWSKGLMPYPSDTKFLFRIVGLPSERITISPPNLLINGKIVTNPEIFSTIAKRKDGYQGFLLPNNKHLEIAGSIHGDRYEMVLGDSEYFVLGDDSRNAYDSRYFGVIRQKDIIGRAIRVYWPLGRLKELVPTFN